MIFLVRTFSPLNKLIIYTPFVRPSAFTATFLYSPAFISREKSRIISFLSALYNIIAASPDFRKTKLTVAFELNGFGKACKFVAVDGCICVTPVIVIAGYLSGCLRPFIS